MRLLTSQAASLPHILFLSFAALVMMSIFAPDLKSQQTTTPGGVTISGTVRDATGAVIPNATVTVINKTTSVAKTGTTDQSGQYRIPEVPFGTYTLEVTASGLGTWSEEIVVKLNTTAGPNPNVHDVNFLAGPLPGGLPGQARNDYVPCIFPKEYRTAFAQGQQPPGPAPTEAKTLDLGCSQSILTWKETSDIFGRRIADTYVAIQVVVRNLDPDHEFLLHDVQIAVDFTAASAHYVSGRDKVLVRGVAIKGQALDRRNFLMNVGEVIGDIAGAASIAFTGLDFKNGVSVYRSAFIPGLGKIFPDFTIDQLNRLNDTGFSANSAYKIVVAKNGAVPFVTFLPAEIYAKGYKKYKPDQLRALSDKTLVVFAGAHITEVTQQPAVKSLSCPQTADGFLDLTKATTQFQCTLTGDNLGLISKIRFVNAADPTQVAAEGNVSTTGSVTFNADDLKKLKGSQYGVNMIDKAGKEVSTGLTVKIHQP